MIYGQDTVDEKGFPTKEFLAECLRNNMTLDAIVAACPTCSRATAHRLIVRYGLVKPKYYAPRGISRETLYQLHVVEGLTAVRIAALLGCHNSTVSKFIRKYGLDPERQLVNHKRVPLLSRDKLTQLYVVEQKSCSEIGKQYGVSKITVNRWLHDYGIPTRVWDQRRRTTYTRSRYPSTRFGKDFSQTTRLKIMRRDGWKCLMCGRADKWLLEAHHIVPVSDGGLATIENGATVCKQCHITIKNREREYITFFQQTILSSVQSCCIGENAEERNPDGTLESAS